MGHPRHPGQPRARRRARLQHVRHGQGARPARCRRQAARPGRRPAVVRAGRAVPALDDAARRRCRRDADRGTDRRQIAGTVAERAGRARVRHPFRRPPWENGALLPEAEARARRAGRRRPDGRPPLRAAVPRDRHRAIGDERARASTAAASASVARASGGSAPFRGHAWQSAVFPSGRAFGYIVYPPRDDGKPTYNEGYLFEGDGELIPAWVVDAPWLRRLQPHGRGRLGRARDRQGHHHDPGRVGRVELSR